MTIDIDVFSADSHVIEPHDLWQQRVERRFVDRAPRLVRGETTDRLVCDDAELPPVGLLAGCARGDDEVRWEGRWEDDVFVGGYDPTARLADLERDGVDAEVLYPTIAMQFYPIRDRAFRWALFRAYNEWLARDFCGAHPERYFGIAMLNHEEVEDSVAEMRRAREMGLVGAMVPLYAGESVRLQDRQFDPIWSTAVELGLPISVEGILSCYNVQRVIVDAILNGLFDRFPELKVVSAENDAGWAGAMVERSDFWWRRNYRVASKQFDLCRNPPSTYFRNNIRVTFMRDHTCVMSHKVFGLETLMWGNDFPHHVSTWPNSQKVLHEHFDDQPSSVRDAIVRENVRALYNV
jgi:predicted TIM-barrel fold metal-dependent hydrolase